MTICLPAKISAYIDIRARLIGKGTKGLKRLDI